MADPALNLKVNVTGAAEGAADISKVATATEATAKTVIKAEEDMARARAQYARDSGSRLEKEYASEVASVVKAQQAKKAATVAAALEAANASERESGANKNNASSAKEAADALQQLAGRNNEAKDAVEGFAQTANGGTSAVFGLAKAWKGLTGVFTGAAGPLGLVVIALTAVKAGLDFLVDRSTAALDAMKNFTGEGERTAAALKQVEDAAKTAFANQKDEVDALTEAYKSLNTQIDAAAARVDKLNEAQTKLKLAKLNEEEAKALSQSSPDSNLREGIKRTFDRKREDVRNQADATRIENTTLKAGVEEKAANDALANFSDQLRQAALATRQANDALEAQRSKLAAVDSSNVNTSFARDIRDAVKVAEAAAKAAADNEAKLQEALAPQIEQANQKRTGANDTRQLADVQKRTLDTEVSTQGTTRRNEDIDRQRQQEQERQKKQAEAIKGNTADIQSAPGFDAQPVAEASKNQSAVVVAKFTESSASAAAAAQAINASTATVAALPVIDLAPVTVAFGQYHNAVLTKFTQIERSVDGLERSIQTLRNQIANSRS